MRNTHDIVASTGAFTIESTEDATNTVAGTTPNHETLIAKLAKLWRNHNNKDLEVRYQVGKEIHEHLAKTADKNGRQPKGDGLMKALADKLDLSVGEVSRMRSFAKKFESFEAFREQHPDVHTWTKVKADVLPKASKPKGDKAKTLKTVKVTTIATRLEKAAIHLNHGLKVDRKSDDGKALYGALCTLIAEANKALGTDFADRTAVAGS